MNRRRALLAILLVLVVVAMATATACGQSAPAPSSSASPSPHSTTVSEPAFRVTLPGSWSDASGDPGTWVYRSTEDEQLTVSVWGLDSGLSRGQREKTMRRVIELRRQSEEAAAASVRLSATRFGNAGGILAARYSGTEPDTGRRLHCLVLGSKRAITFVYYESLTLPPQQSDARARSIFNTVAVPG
jgi:hypothetical protein